MIIKRSPRHRKCRYPECKQVLSVYNHGSVCCMHQEALARSTGAIPHKLR